MNYHNWTKTDKLQAPCFKTKKQIEGASGLSSIANLVLAVEKTTNLSPRCFTKQ